MDDLKFSNSSESIPKAANKDVSKKNKKKELNFEEKVENLIVFIQFEPLLREIYYKILKFCLQRRGLTEIENEVAQYPEFKQATRDQYSLIMELANHYGLKLFELDKDKNPVSEKDKIGLSEDEIDDLIVSFAFETTDVGQAVVEQFDPQNRLELLIEEIPERLDTYSEILTFLQEKHSFAEVNSLLQGRDILKSQTSNKQAILPSVFIDKLEKAGGIYFENGWQTTSDGEVFLKKISKEKND